MLKAIKIAGLFFGLLPVAFVALPASADPKQMLIEKDWGAYRYDDSAGRICFISSVPTESKGKYDPNNRGETRVFVSHGPDKAERNVVQVVAGTSSRGTKTTDKYSLSGFTKTKSIIDKTCK